MDNKLAYIYDHRYLEYNNEIYSSGALTHSLWDRFLNGFGSVTVFGNIKKAKKEEVEHLNKVGHRRVNFVDIGYMTSFKEFVYGLFIDNDFIKRSLKDYDAVIVRVPGELSFNAYRIAKKLKKPIGLEVVGCPWDAYWNHGNLKGKLLAPIAYFRMKNIVRQSSNTVYVTKSFLQNRYPTKGKTINASNVEVKVPSSNILLIKKNYLIRKEQVIRIGLMGSSNVRYKGHKELLRAVAEVKNELPLFQIEFTGPGEVSWIKKIVSELNLQDNVVYNGKLASGTPIFNWLDQLDLYVHPSKQEGLPRSVIEAMSRACPVLASSIAGIPELLDLDFMHQPGDYKKLAQDLKKVLNNKEFLIKMSQSNYEKSKEYDIEILNIKRKIFWSEFAAQI